jgi:hypothetical protein
MVGARRGRSTRFTAGAAGSGGAGRPITRMAPPGGKYRMAARARKSQRVGGWGRRPAGIASLRTSNAAQRRGTRMGMAARRRQFAPTGQDIPAQGKRASAPPWVANPARQAPQRGAIKRRVQIAPRCGAVMRGRTYPARRACGACTGLRYPAPLGPIETPLSPLLAGCRGIRGKRRSTPRRAERQDGHKSSKITKGRGMGALPTGIASLRTRDAAAFTNPRRRTPGWKTMMATKAQKSQRVGGLGRYMAGCL